MNIRKNNPFQEKTNANVPGKRFIFNKKVFF